ncbi:MAG: response regulator [Chloroflexi bacterium]|nr:response regulator [Chloroflexota bacterium]
MPRILVIDDEPDLRLALSITFEDYGYDAIEGVDGTEVLDLAVTHSPDLIILDLNMPIIDGLTALQILKNDERTFSIPVCILTAVKDPEREQRARSLGAEEFFSKPWSEEHLVRRVGELIRQHAVEVPNSDSSASDTPDAHEATVASSDTSSATRVARLSETIRARHNIW